MRVKEGSIQNSGAAVAVVKLRTVRKNRAMIQDILFASDKLLEGVKNKAPDDEEMESIHRVVENTIFAFELTPARDFAKFLDMSRKTIHLLNESSWPESRDPQIFRKALLKINEQCFHFLSLIDAEPLDLSEGMGAWLAAPKQATAYILRVSQSLDSLLAIASGSNLGPAQLLNGLQRAQLVAILETALLHLKAPIVEPGFLRSLGRSLKKIGERAIEKQAELALGSAAAVAGRELLALIVRFFK